MTHVVLESCIRCKYTDCVVVCPVECFYEGEKMLYIHPDECIDCEACVPECPVEAIFHEDNVPEEWKDFTALNAEMASQCPVITEKKEPLEGLSIVGGKLIATYLKDVTSHVYIYDRHGKLENELALPAPGSASGFGGEKTDKETFYSFTTLNYPPTIFRYDIASHQTTLFRAPEIPGFSAGDETGSGNEPVHHEPGGCLAPVHSRHDAGHPPGS